MTDRLKQLKAGAATTNDVDIEMGEGDAMIAKGSGGDYMKVNKFQFLGGRRGDDCRFLFIEMQVALQKLFEGRMLSILW